MANFRVTEVFRALENYLEKELIPLTSTDANWWV